MNKIKKLGVQLSAGSKPVRVDARISPDLQGLLGCCPKGSVGRVDERNGAMVTYLITLPKGNSLHALNRSIALIQSVFKGRARSCSSSMEGLEATLRVRLSSLGEESAVRLNARTRLMADTLDPWQRSVVLSLKPHVHRLELQSVTSSSVELLVNSVQLLPELFAKLSRLKAFFYITSVASKQFSIRINKEAW